MSRKQLAARIVAARKRAGYSSRYQLRDVSGVATSTLGSIENGEVSPSVETLEKIMKAIGWQVNVTFRPETRGRPRS